MRLAILLLGLLSVAPGEARLLAGGHMYGLECLNDYFFTISCSLNVSLPAPPMRSCWLLFLDLSDDQEHVCVLKGAHLSFSCELNLSTVSEYYFIDTDAFEISLLCSFHGNNRSEVLVEEYLPAQHIRPVPPSNLSLLLDTEQARFRWLNGYEQQPYRMQGVHYHLHIHSQHQELSIHVMDKSASVGVAEFKPHTNYTARLRSRPNQVYYGGVWSHWGPSLHWTSLTYQNITSANENKGWKMSLMSWSLILLCVIPLPILCYIPFSRWRKREFIPTPAPYFGDWDANSHGKVMIQSDLHKREESLKIDALTEVPAWPNGAIRKSGDADSNTCLAMPLRSPSMPHLPVVSAVESGRWLPGFMVLRRGIVSCSEEYCTLSPRTTEHSYTN